MACLVIVEGPAIGTHFALASHKLVSVGRDEECAVQIVDPAISRQHLQIRVEDGVNHIVVDNRSANGVLVNGSRIAIDTLLKNGDEIKIGGTRIVYSITDYPDAQSALAGVRSGGEWKLRTLTSE